MLFVPVAFSKSADFGSLNSEDAEDSREAKKGPVRDRREDPEAHGVAGFQFGFSLEVGFRGKAGVSIVDVLLRLWQHKGTVHVCSARYNLPP